VRAHPAAGEEQSFVLNVYFKRRLDARITLSISHSC
jgi:hypothetical protein